MALFKINGLKTVGVKGIIHGQRVIRAKGYTEFTTLAKILVYFNCHHI